MHGRHGDDIGESTGEGGARQAGLSGEFFNRPVRTRIFMKGKKGAPEIAIAYGRERSPSYGAAIGLRPQKLDKKYFSDARRERLGAERLARGLRRVKQADGVFHPAKIKLFRGAHDMGGRQSVEQQQTGVGTERQIPADETGGFAAVIDAMNQNAAIVKTGALDHIVKADKVGADLAQEEMRASVGNDRAITAFHRNRPGAGYIVKPDIASGNEMNPNRVAMRGHAHAPGRVKLGSEKEAALKVKDFENIAE